MTGVYDFSSGFNSINNAINGLGSSLREQRKQQTLAEIGSQISGGDYGGAAQCMFSMGDVGNGVKLLELGRGQQQVAGATQAFNSAVSPVGAGSPPAANVSSNGGGDVENRFMTGIRNAGLTNPAGLGVVAAYGRAESGFSPRNANRVWADSSESGQPGMSGGIMSWRGDRLRNLYKFAAQRGEMQGNITPETQAAFLASEDPQLIPRLNAAKTPEEANQIMANSWRFAGYDRPGGENARRLAMAQRYATSFGGNEGAQVASAEADMPAVGAQPTQGYFVPGQTQQQGQGRGFDAASAQRRVAHLQSVLGQPGLSDGQRQAVKAELDQIIRTSDPLYQAKLTNATAEAQAPPQVRALEWRAREAGLQPGTPEYQQFIAEGGRAPRNAESDRRIRALESRGMSRADAENAVYGLTQVVVDPVIGSPMVVDRTTGAARPVNIQQSQPQAQAPQGAQLPKLYDLADIVTGAIPAAQEAWTDVAPQFGLPGIDGIVEARQIVNAAGRDLIRALSINPRFPVGEMKAIEQEINIAPGVFKSSDGLKQRMKGVDAVLRRRLENENRTANNESLPVEARRNALQAVNDISNFLNTLGVPQEAAPAASTGAPVGERTATDPQTGQKLILRNGQWEALR